MAKNGIKISLRTGQPFHKCTSAIAVVVLGLTSFAAALVVGPAIPVGATPASWTITPSPSFKNVQSYLEGVSCTATSSCVAVGYEGLLGSYNTLIESWDGHTWATVPSPNEGYESILTGVSCPDSNFCIAVGYYAQDPESQGSQVLIETWNGSVWSIAQPAGLVSGYDILNSVSCTSSLSCVAVGVYLDSSGFIAMSENWDGSTWELESSAAVPGSSSYQFEGVSCVRTTQPNPTCTAVGTNQASGEAFIEVWDGISWSLSPPGTTSDPNTGLSGISCVSQNACLAVGFEYSSTAPPFGALVESWDGTNWTVVSNPSGPGPSTTLSGVSCVNAANCVAVGSFGGSDSTSYDTLVETWNGSTLAVVPSADSESPTNELVGVSCGATDGPTLCEAVGYFGTGSNDQGLVETGPGLSSCNQLTITTSSMPEGTVGQPYSFALSACGGKPPYTWNKYPPKGNGANPPGLHFSTAGALSGTPKKAGTYFFTFKVLDSTHSHKTQATKTLDLVIDP